MDVANELLDAIEIIVDKKVRENTAQIYPGICKSVSGNSCVMSINGKDNTIQFYGSIPTVGAIYRVFVPDGNMSMAFAITGNDDRKDLHYSNPNLLDNWYFANPVNQRGQTSWVNPSDWQYSIDRWQITPSSVIALVDGGITITADFHQGLEKDRLEFGRTYTFSVLSSDGRLGKHTFVLTSDTDINVGFGFGYFVCYLSGDNAWFRIYGDGSTYKAAKLELGSQQTLAHQDADGNWVLNEIPDYGEQLARCQRHQLRVGYKEGSTYSPVFATGVAVSSASIRALIPTPVTMRENPVISFFGSDTISTIHAIGNGVSLTPTAIDARVNSNEIFLNLTVSGATVNETYAITLDHARGLMLDANL